MIQLNAVLSILKFKIVDKFKLFILATKLQGLPFRSDLFSQSEFSKSHNNIFICEAIVAQNFSKHILSTLNKPNKLPISVYIKYFGTMCKYNNKKNVKS